MLILDKNGILVSVALPPVHDDPMNEALKRDLEALTDIGIACPHSKRGNFTILEHGMQFGGGSTIPGPRNSGNGANEIRMRKAALQFFGRTNVKKFCDKATGKCVFSSCPFSDKLQIHFNNIFQS